MALAQIMQSLGFQSAQDSKLNYILPTIICDGNTAFRDAVFQGNQLMLKLHSLCSQFNFLNKYKFVHVVLTDGEDNSSQISLEAFLKYQLALKIALPENILQTFYIGVNLENNDNVRLIMQAILQCSGNTAQYYPISSNGINDIFKKIQMQLGIRIQERAIILGNQNVSVALSSHQIQPVLQFQINNYIVLFTLDISGSMQLHWPKVCSAVKGFLNNLGSDDLVLGILFNDQVHILNENEKEIHILDENEKESSLDQSSLFKDALKKIQDQASQNSQNMEESDDQNIKMDEDNSHNDQEINSFQSDQEKVNPLNDNEEVSDQHQPSEYQPTPKQQNIQETLESSNNKQKPVVLDQPQNPICSCQINCQIF